jgi:hypothetical protein
MKVFLGFLTVIIVVALVLVGSYITNYNYGNRSEVQINAAYDNVQQVYSTYTNKVMEAAQVNEMYRDDVREVIVSALNARYGEDGSQSVFNWIKESNPTLDPSVYTQLQQIIESGRNRFQNEQTRLIEFKAAYEASLGYFWKGFWLRLAGYPKINLDDYKIVKSNRTNDVYETGVDSPLDIRN